MTFLNTDLNCESFIDSNLRTAETDDIVPYGVAPVGQHTPGCISDNAAVPETSAGIPQISPELFFPGPGWNFIGHYDRQQSETSQASSNFPSSQNGRTTPGSSQDAHRSPPKDFNKQESSLMVNNYRKRKTDPEGMNPMTIIFPLNGSVAHRQGRAKTPFSRTRRPEVALVRKVGSCARCKIQRVSVGQPCHPVSLT
jgi:hypothetical protein